MKYFLVINLGLRSIRAILFDQDAKIVDKNWYPITTYIQGDTVEQNPKEWWGLCEGMLQELLASKPEYKEHISSITVTSSASCLVVIDKQGMPLMNALMVSDKRATLYANQLQNAKEYEHIFQNPNHLATPAFMIPKMMWLQKHKKVIFPKIHYFMNAGDFLNYKLTGKCITDRLNAEKFYYDSDKKEFPTIILKKLGIKKSQLPEVVEPGSEIGTIAPTLSKKIDCNPKTTIIISSYDAICAFLGSGLKEIGYASNVCGTVSSLRVMTKQKPKKTENMLVQQIDSDYIVGGSNNIDGGLLEWSKHMFYGDSYPDQYIYKIMEDEAESSPPGANGLLFLPYLIGERFPFNDEDMRGMYFGLERYHKRNDSIRSVFEAGGFMTYDMIQQIEKNGIKIHTIHMSGGLVQNRLACKIRADITGKKIVVIDNHETTSLGALYLIWKTLGITKNLKSFSRFVTTGETYHPDKQNHALYQNLFKLYKQVYAANKDLMKQRAALLKTIQSKTPFVLENL